MRNLHRNVLERKDRKATASCGGTKEQVNGKRIYIKKKKSTGLATKQRRELHEWENLLIEILCEWMK